jgi:hypothetical protein
VTTSWATTLASGIAAAAAVVAVLSAPDEVQWPELHTNCVTDIWPQLDLEQITVGGYEFEAYEAFGMRNTRPLLLDSLEPRRCIGFIYDENLIWDTPLAITVLVADGRVHDRWLGKVPFSAPECKGLPHEAIDLTGYFHARACWEP